MIEYIGNGMKKWWYMPFCVYVLPNVFMAIFIAVINLLIVDNIPLQLTATTFQIFLSLFLIIVSFYYIKITALKFGKLSLKYKESLPGKYLGVFIFIMQLLQLFALLIFDFGRVGGAASSNNPYVVIISYIPSDIIFLLYYGHYRTKGLPVFNLGLYLILSTLQGWTGIWLIVFLIEFYHQLRIKPFKSAAKKGLIILVILISLYPLINQVKYTLRGGADFQEKTIIESGGELINRLQHESGVILISQQKDEIITALDRDEIIPYYLDNRIGTMFAYSKTRVSLQRYLTTNYLIDKSLFSEGTDIDDLGWYTNVGMAGWFQVLSSVQIFFYIVFLILLTTLPFLINHYFLKSKGIVPVLQTLTLIYIFHGWFTVQISFIAGILIYTVLFNVLKGKEEKKKSILSTGS